MIKLSVDELRTQASKVDQEKENLSSVLASLDTIPLMTTILGIIIEVI